MNILLPAGVHGDTAIARDVMGWRIITAEQSLDLTAPYERVALVMDNELYHYQQERTSYWALKPWRPTTDLRHAWQALEAACALGLFLTLRGPLSETDDQYIATLRRPTTAPEDSKQGPVYICQAETAALALCRAAFIACHDLVSCRSELV